MVLLQQLHVKNNKAQKGELRMKRFFTHFMRILLCIVLCYDAYILIPGVKDGVNGFFENIAENISDFKEEIRSFFSTAETESAESASSSESKEITFNPVMNAYYEMLDDNQKKLYAQMYKTAETAESSFTPFSDTVNQEDVDTAFHAMCYDHPELFWMDGQYSVSYYEESGRLSVFSWNIAIWQMIWIRQRRILMMAYHRLFQVHWRSRPTWIKSAMFMTL
jgi:hypothetical protein